jgi:hypothetical protein
MSTTTLGATPLRVISLAGRYPFPPPTCAKSQRVDADRAQRPLAVVAVVVRHQVLGRLQELVGALTNPTLKELLYQFEEPFIVDSSRIAAELGVVATPAEQAIADTLATYRAADARAA